ncbi:Proline-rich receptor-like protein kinase PERK1 [Dendrobium catenatum]|uniref:non-specific serine/threonine protein kinase n=2 Tax=Dendrobium catenatum TaxID=906689 RepID=A0A2I0X9P1_9ASPA|nr:Proline-rich receptor-like protein kinase PERK1 [Dendrobium catenatum]
MLVYDFIPNRTLEYHLHGKGLPVMDWSTRLKIAIGSAKGIAYLHEECHPRIIHRDIKSSNILLDFKFEAMVADFGLAKLSSDNHTHVSTRVMGTFGYLAPEYASSGKLTEKSDVFSYGVMLLELITGQRPVGSSHAFMEDSLVDWARPVLFQALADGNYDDVADHRLNGNYDTVEMARMIACAAACVRHSARRRPKMSQIVSALEGNASLEDLNEGMRPGQSMLFSSSSDYDSDLYAPSMRRIRRIELTSPEYSGDYSGPIAEYEHGSEPSSGEQPYSDDLNTLGNSHRFPAF